MFAQTPIKNLALRRPSLLGAAACLHPRPRREAATGGDVPDPDHDAASHLNLPAAKTLTQVEQKTCFQQATLGAGRPTAGIEGDSAATLERAVQPAVEPPWKFANRTRNMKTSAVRDLLALASRPDIITLAGGLPSPDTFPMEALADACDRVLGAKDARSALQYSASEGLLALREAIAASLPWEIDPANVLITTGSQQALDLVAKILVDPGSKILVETPTYVGALQAFQPMEPNVVCVDSDEFGMLPEDLAAKVEGARLLYILPNFQNPTGRTMDEARRAAISDIAARAGVPVLEDNPYGELWYDTPPPAPMAARRPEQTLYMGSFSKTLLPGMRLGYLIVPSKFHHPLVMAKQAADLHTSSLDQHLVFQMQRDGFLGSHVPGVRVLYKGKRDAMLAALEREMSGLGVAWNRPAGGMFLWLRLPEGLSATDLLPRAVAKGVAFVPGKAFYAADGDDRTLRLSFVTASTEQIAAGIAALGAAVREALEAVPTLPDARAGGGPKDQHGEYAAGIKE